MSEHHVAPQAQNIDPFTGAGALAVVADLFRFEGMPVRLVMREGDPWFIAADVCRILGLNNVSMALRILDEDEKHTLSSVEGIGDGRAQSLNIISEPGLYKLMGRSRKPEAKRFDRWVRHEVLPAIRKTGGYLIAVPEETPEELALRAMTVLQATVERQKAQLALVQPKADALDRIAEADGSLNITEAAKALQVRPSDLFRWLSGNGWIYKRPGSANWLGYQARTQSLDLEHKVTTVTRPDGTDKVTEQVRVTAQGLTKLAKLMPGRMTVIDGGQA